MIQILPHVPGFGERLADAITSGAGAFGQGYLKQMEQQRSQQALADVANPEKTPLQRFQAYGNLNPELQRNLAQPFSALIGPEAQAAADYNQYIQGGGNPNQVPQGVNAPPQSSQGQPPPQPTNQSQVAPTLNAGAAPQSQVPSSDVRTDEDLTKALRYKNSKNPYQKADADQAQAELDRRNAIRENLTKGEEKERKKFTEERDYHTQFSKPILDQNTKNLQSFPEKNLSIKLARDAVATGDTSGIGAYLANASGIDSLKNASTVQLQSALKNFLLKDIGSIGTGRPNQWIEQQIAAAYPTIGTSQESQEAVLAAMQAQLSLQEATANAIQRIAQSDRELYGFVRDDVAERAVKESAAEAKPIQDKLALDLRQNYEKNKTDAELRSLYGNKETKVPQGTPITQRTAQILHDKYGDRAVEAAKKLGFDLSGG